MPHPLHLFRHCPRCGCDAFSENDERSKRCASCNFVFYHNASAATVAVIIDEQGRLLITRRALEPAKGTLDLPGGFVDPGESIEDGCLREVLEETGAEAILERYLFSLPNTYRFSDFDVHTTDAFFLVKIKPGHKLRPNDDAAELFWCEPHRLSPDDFGLQSIREGVRRLLPLLSELT